MEKKARTQSNPSRLSARERSQLEGIAGGDSVHSQRAQALLALDHGTTLAAAAEESGLTVSAIRYWKSKFQQQGMAIFPGELLPAVKAGPDGKSKAQAREPTAAAEESEAPPKPPTAKKKKESPKGGGKKAKKKGKPKKKGKKKAKKKAQKGDKKGKKTKKK